MTITDIIGRGLSGLGLVAMLGCSNGISNLKHDAPDPKGTGELSLTQLTERQYLSSAQLLYELVMGLYHNHANMPPEHAITEITYTNTPRRTTLNFRIGKENDFNRKNVLLIIPQLPEQNITMYLFDEYTLVDKIPSPAGGVIQMGRYMLRAEFTLDQKGENVRFEGIGRVESHIPGSQIQPVKNPVEETIQLLKRVFTKYKHPNAQEASLDLSVNIHTNKSDRELYTSGKINDLIERLETRVNVSEIYNYTSPEQFMDVFRLAHIQYKLAEQKNEWSNFQGMTYGSAEHLYDTLLDREVRKRLTIDQEAAAILGRSRAEQNRTGVRLSITESAALSAVLKRGGADLTAAKNYLDNPDVLFGRLENKKPLALQEMYR